MNAEMEELYKLIGQSIVDSIPGSWETAKVSIDLEPDVVTAKGFYVPRKGSSPQSFKVNYSTVKHFKKLHGIMSGTPKGDWKHARFELDREGHFDLSFEY